MTTAESTTVFPSGVFASEVEFSRASVAEEGPRPVGKLVWSKALIAAAAVAASTFGGAAEVVKVATSKALVLASSGHAAIADEDLEDLVDAAATRRDYQASKIQGLTRYRDYREKRLRGKA